jgi:hypothetical protein
MRLRVILIIEGTDLVGKSTIAEQCAASHGWPIVKIRWSLVGDVEAEPEVWPRRRPNSWPRPGRK